jgi:hypothetical protein
MKNALSRYWKTLSVGNEELHVHEGKIKGRKRLWVTQYEAKQGDSQFYVRCTFSLYLGIKRVSYS